MRFNVILCLLLLFPSAQNYAIEFTEGDYYVVLDNEKSNKKQVTEYFSFYCPACFKQEPFMNELKRALPSDAIFKKNHVDGMPGRDTKVEHALSKALVTAKKLGVEDKMVAAIFNYIHLSKARFNQDRDIRNLFLINGVEAGSFDRAYESFAVDMQAKRMKRQTQKLRNQGFRSVPTLVVNNKYKPVTDKIRSTEEYINLINYLLNK